MSDLKSGIAFPEFEPGTVWLVGAGPGDPGLLTALALHALQTCDVLVYDALVSDDILSLVHEGAEKIHAGKRGGKPSPKQPDITARLVTLARENKRVLRLKGGDPFVFGRGGEEALVLKSNEVPFRIVPGISSGIGGLAYAGIPVTHRDTNSAITILTGHGASGDVPDTIDWEHVAKSSPSLIIYMGLKHIRRITDKLMEHGRPKDEPVAIVSNASLPDQKVLRTNLSQCADDIDRFEFKPPCIIVVGSNARLHDDLNWAGAVSMGDIEWPPVPHPEDKAS